MTTTTRRRPDRRFLVGAMCTVVAVLVPVLGALLGGGASTDGSATPAVTDGALVLRLAGSGTMGKDLAPRLAENFLRQGDGQVNTERPPNGSGANQMIRVHGTRDDQPITIEIAVTNSADAFTALANGTTDIGMSSRPINDAERAALGRAAEDVYQDRVIAQDAVAVIVNQGNLIQSISVEALRAIYDECTATRPSWSEVGSDQEGAISAWASGDESDTVAAFQELVLPGRADLPVCESVNRPRTDDGQTISDAVSADRLAIGIVGLPFVGDNKTLQLPSSQRVGLVGPDAGNIYSRDYPLIQDLHLYWSRTAANPLAAEFAEFTHSTAGRNTVVQAGFRDPNADLRLGESPPAGSCSDSQPQFCPFELLPSDGCPGSNAAYCELVDNSQRLKFSMNFLNGSSTLNDMSPEVDTLTVQRLDDLCTVLRSTAYLDYRITLAGFTDSSGSQAKNLELSRARVATVRQALADRHISADRIVGAEGFGEDGGFVNPGLPDNRRVEIWLQKQ